MSDITYEELILSRNLKKQHLELLKSDITYEELIQIQHLQGKCIP